MNNVKDVVYEIAEATVRVHDRRRGKIAVGVAFTAVQLLKVKYTQVAASSAEVMAYV